jgi:hypothetical protein
LSQHHDFDGLLRETLEHGVGDHASASAPRCAQRPLHCCLQRGCGRAAAQCVDDARSPEPSEAMNLHAYCYPLPAQMS